MNIQKGKPVPSFKLEDEKGNIVSSENLLGSKYILFFYPKDDSPGCTKEACSVRDNYKALTKKGYKVFGVSPDKAKKHQKFIDKYEFQYPLLADTEKEMINAFGLWGPKKFMGREIVGVYRKTVLVNEKGIISHIIEKVVTKAHGQQILDVIENSSELVTA
ncbi:MAG: thioredoxin-dependent thiol peroxidase [Saprospiraceae bacterium]|nr:thioredoxin-dependent thiol peroxidase [Bacteroidia bacterium]NNE14340.1 thioredoxin-dependent thiol peroxidase [Saprospiraceae bacterium]NNL92739.1 thioredoxin-dependent thiol peroxidase [Saprospiraceae bacterium]